MLPPYPRSLIAVGADWRGGLPRPLRWSRCCWPGLSRAWPLKLGRYRPLLPGTQLSGEGRVRRGTLGGGYGCQTGAPVNIETWRERSLERSQKGQVCLLIYYWRSCQWTRPRTKTPLAQHTDRWYSSFQSTPCLSCRAGRLLGRVSTISLSLPSSLQNGCMGNAGKTTYVACLAT